MPKPRTPLLALGLAGALSGVSWAESRDPDDDSASLKPRFYDPNYYQDESSRFTPPSLADSDFGDQRILKKPRRQPFRFDAEALTFWSNNIGDDSTAEEEGWGYGGRMSLRWNHEICKDVRVDAYTHQDFYRFDADDLDYETSEFGVGVLKLCPQWGDFMFFGRYEFLYVRADDPTGDLYTRLHRLRVGAGKTVIDKQRHSLFVGWDSRYDLDANVGEIKRHQHSGRVAYTYRINHRLSATGYYRLSYRNYQNSDREDWHQGAGAELTYSLSNWARVYANFLYRFNESNEDDRDYETVDGGLSLGLRGEF